MANIFDHAGQLVAGTARSGGLFHRSCEIAEATGREVVRETLLAIGLDVADPVKRQRDFVTMCAVGALATDAEFRPKDIEHTRKWQSSKSRPRASSPPSA